MEMTTGMSAPPIGMMIRAPNTSAVMVMAQNSTGSPPERQKLAISTTNSAASAALIRWRAGRMMGLPDMRPDSLAKAITEPVKVTAPMATPSDISNRLVAAMSRGWPMPKASGAYSAPAATNTAANPTSEWNAATSSGIDVIGMRRAMAAPMLPPMP